MTTHTNLPTAHLTEANLDVEVTYDVLPNGDIDITAVLVGKVDIAGDVPEELLASFRDEIIDARADAANEDQDD